MTESGHDTFAHRPRRFWRRVVVEAPVALVEATADLLGEISGSGVEIAPAPAGCDGGARERVIGYLAGEGPVNRQEERLRDGLGELERRHGRSGEIVVRREEVREEDWGAGWKEHFHPFRAAPRLMIRPSWESCETRPGEAVIEMDPGMAFGTGLHSSTRLALGFIEELCAGAPPARALDIGTGTGILAMAAALWGAARVTALDTDPDAVAAARRNVALNGLAARVGVDQGGISAASGPFDLIAANITADVLLELAQQIVGRLAPGGVLVLSGLLAGEQAGEIRAAYERLGLLGALERVDGEWAALMLASPAGEEVFDVVDGEGRAVGRAPRSLCHRAPSLLHRVSHVLVTDGKGLLYLQRRPATKDIEPCRWDTSVGGHLDAGEDHEAGARREMREELGLAGELRFLHRYLWKTARETELVETYLHVACEEPRPHPGEIDEGRWFTLSEAAALAGCGEGTSNLGEELRRLADAGGLPGKPRP